MIPAVEEIIGFEYDAKEPTKTYYFDIEHKRIMGNVDGLEAMKQAVYLILETECSHWDIYNSGYGSGLTSLIGEPMTYVIPESERLIREALFRDDRIIEVNNFEFEINNSKLHITFDVVTDHGSFEVSRIV